MQTMDHEKVEHDAALPALTSKILKSLNAIKFLIKPFSLIDTSTNKRQQ
jgi:hypothetical protein